MLIGKLYIWNCKHLDVLPSMRGFASRALDYITVERCIADMTKDKEKFNKKWLKLVELLKNSERPP